MLYEYASRTYGWSVAEVDAVPMGLLVDYVCIRMVMHDEKENAGKYIDEIGW